MRFSINLRGDLAKLSDVELVERLEAAWQSYETAEKPSWLDWKLLWRWRGPLRFPLAYRFLSVLSRTTASNGWLWLAVAAVLSSKSAEPFVRGDPAIDVHSAKFAISRMKWSVAWPIGGDDRFDREMRLAELKRPSPP